MFFGSDNENEYLFGNKVQIYMLLSAVVVLAAAIASLIYFIKTSSQHFHFFYLVVAILWTCVTGDLIRLMAFAQKPAFISLCIVELLVVLIDLIFLHTWFIAAFSVICAVVTGLVIRSYWILMDWYGS